MHRVFLGTESRVVHPQRFALVVVKIAIAHMAEADDADAGHQRLQAAVGGGDELGDA
ncbi:hypothetical protein D3C73_1582000 [compost metagenome]